MLDALNTYFKEIIELTHFVTRLLNLTTHYCIFDEYRF
jgi:hypothetical protein